MLGRVPSASGLLPATVRDLVAARLRDEIQDLKKELRQMVEAGAR